MWTLIKLGLMLLVGILIYNYFFGSVEEKDTSKKIFTEVRDLSKATWGLLRSEKQKFNEGKYDEAVDKVDGLLDRLRGHAKTIDDNKDLLTRLDRLDRERNELEEKIDHPSNYEGTEKQRQAEVRREWEALMAETEDLMQDMERRK